MKLLKENKTIFNLILITLGLLRLFYVLISVFFLRICHPKRKRIIIIGPVHSQHIKNFLKKIREVSNQGKFNILLINSDPNSFTRSNQLNSIIIDISVYKLLGYRNSKNDWLEKIFLNAENSLNNRSKNFLCKVITWYKPDHFWIHDLQSAGYLSLPLFNLLDFSKIKTYAAVWGNDLFYFSDIPSHKKKLEVLLKNIDLIHVESSRDIDIAKHLGYKGEFLPISSFTLTDIDQLKINKNNCVKDIYILLKGSYYLRSNIFPFLKDLAENQIYWKNKKIVIVGPSIEDVFHFEKVKNRLGLSIEFLQNVPNKEYIKLLSRSQYHLSLNLSDGIPNSALEAVYSDSIPVLSSFTGLYTSLSEELKEVICYDLSQECNFQFIFERLDKIEINQRHVLLNELRGLFENVLYNNQIQERIVLKLLN